jgi:hypothetical protein
MVKRLNKQSCCVLIYCACAVSTSAVAMAVAPDGHFEEKAASVLDTATHLTWERRTSSATYSFAQAQQYCAALTNDDGSGWRVPSLVELLSLVDEARATPAIDTRAFPGTPAEYFWSSSKPMGAADRASVVNFRFGFDGILAVDTLQRVRCVR